jgi:hypothetical protein
MTLLSFTYELANSDAFISCRTYAVPGLRVTLHEHRGVFAHDAALRARAGSAEPQNWPALVIALDGTMAVADGFEERRGAFYLAPAFRELVVSHGDDYGRRLVVSWNAPAFGASGVVAASDGRLSPTALAHAKCLARLLTAAEPVNGMTHALASLLSELRRSGVATAPNGVENATMPGPLASVATALSRALASSSGMPASSDVEAVLSRSRAGVHRTLRRYFDLLDFSTTSWREFRSVVVLNAAGALMTARGAKTEEVARIVGFSSGTALCRAFAHAGLPSPSAMRAAIVDRRQRFAEAS